MILELVWPSVVVNSNANNKMIKDTEKFSSDQIKNETKTLKQNWKES